MSSPRSFAPNAIGSTVQQLADVQASQAQSAQRGAVGSAVPIWAGGARLLLDLLVWSSRSRPRGALVGGSHAEVDL